MEAKGRDLFGEDRGSWDSTQIIFGGWRLTLLGAEKAHPWKGGHLGLFGRGSLRQVDQTPLSWRPSAHPP